MRRRWRYATIDPADSITVPEARREARQIIAGFLDTPAKTTGPRTPGRPMTEFAAEFIERHARHWKPSTLETNRRFIDKCILPAFGHMTVDEITVEHVRDWFASMAERRGIANRCVPVLSTMMRIAELWGYGLHNTNPCKNTRRYPMAPKERYLSPEEIGGLNAVLTHDEFYRPHVVAVIGLLLTGCRVGEIVSLEWDWIKGKRILLPDSKSGPRTVWLSSAARAVIDGRLCSPCRYAPCRSGGEDREHNFRFDAEWTYCQSIMMAPSVCCTEPGESATSAKCAIMHPRALPENHRRLTLAPRHQRCTDQPLQYRLSPLGSVVQKSIGFQPTSAIDAFVPSPRLAQTSRNSW